MSDLPDRKAWTEADERALSAWSWQSRPHAWDNDMTGVEVQAPTREQYERIWDAVTGLDPLDPEPDDEPDDDASRFVDQASGAALRGLASAMVIMFAVVMLLVAVIAEPALEKTTAGVLFVGCLFALHRIGRGGDRG